MLNQIRNSKARKATPGFRSPGSESRIACRFNKYSAGQRFRGLGSFLCFLYLVLALAWVSDAVRAHDASAPDTALMHEPTAAAGMQTETSRHRDDRSDFRDATVPAPKPASSSQRTGWDAVSPFHWMYLRWRTVADWSALQPIHIRLLIGSVIVALAYLLFVGTLTVLVGNRESRLFFRRREGRSGKAP